MTLKVKLACASCHVAKLRCDLVGDFCKRKCSRCDRLNLGCTGALRSRADLHSKRALAVRSEEKNAYRLYDHCPGLNDPPIESKKFLRIILDPQKKNMTLAAVANAASKKIVSIAHAKGFSSRVATLADVYDLAFQMISVHGSRMILVEWGVVMGKEKGTKYDKRPVWWPGSVEFKDPKKLKSHGQFFFFNTDLNAANLYLQLSELFSIMSSADLMVRWYRCGRYIML